MISFGKEAEQSIKEAIVKQAFETTDDAKKLAPVDLGHLKQNIVPRKVDDLSWNVISYAKYSPLYGIWNG